MVERAIFLLCSSGTALDQTSMIVQVIFSVFPRSSLAVLPRGFARWVRCDGAALRFDALAQRGGG
jgi:hypothetical protein